MKLATTTSDFSHYANTPAEALALLAQTPFRNVDLYLPHSFMGEDYRTLIYDAGNAAAKYGMTFVQSHAGDFFAGNDFMLTSLGRALESCKMLNIPGTVIHAQGLPGSGYPAGKQAFFDYNLSLYKKLYPLMEKYDIAVYIENSAEANMGNSFYFMTGSEMAEFLEKANHPLLRAVWDTGHANLRGNDQYRDICDLGNRLAAIHVHDNDGRCDEHTAPFHGTIDLDPVIRGLIDTGFRGCFTFEADNFPLNDRSWPYTRRDSGSGKIRQVPLAIKLAYESILYDTGKFLLTSYGIFEP